MDVNSQASVGLVVIGRNEGERLRMCLSSLPVAMPRVYVDSGSTDHSQATAKEHGFAVIELSDLVGFTAARARNAGLGKLLKDFPNLTYVQMIDGDCEIEAGWLAKAEAALECDPQMAVVFGRRRERFPQASIYNLMCDDEWNVPIGLAKSCGGDAMFRVSSLVSAGGYPEEMIAGEEPDLCLRLRRSGWKVVRLAGEMTKHDAAIHSFRQWWQRTRRSGHAFAELVDRHRFAAETTWIRQLMSIFIWSGIQISALVAVSIWLAFRTDAPLYLSFILFAVLLIQFVRIVQRFQKAIKKERSLFHSAMFSLLLIFGKLAQIQGVCDYLAKRALRKNGVLIEYK